MQIGSKMRDVDVDVDVFVDVEPIVGEFEDHRLREELRSCQPFLVDSELERARHEVFINAFREPQHRNCQQTT